MYRKASVGPEGVPNRPASESTSRASPEGRTERGCAAPSGQPPRMKPRRVPESECRPEGPYGAQGRRFPCSARLSLPARSDAPDESGGSYESECRPEGPYGAQGRRFPCSARLSLHFRSDPPDESGGSYESECRPGGPYGALSLMSHRFFSFLEELVQRLRRRGGVRGLAEARVGHDPADLSQRLDVVGRSRRRRGEQHHQPDGVVVQ